MSWRVSAPAGARGLVIAIAAIAGAFWPQAGVLAAGGALVASVTGQTGSARIMPLPDDGDGPDVSALRYYISQGQKERAEIELQRLRRLYPDWSISRDILEAPVTGAVDEQPFWDLFAAGELDKLREEIDKRMREEPGWRPSQDLSAKIRGKEIRQTITALWKDGKTDELLAFVKREGYGGDEADIDIIWTVAEAYARAKQNENALEVYMSVLRNNTVPGQRLATVQKAMANLRMADVEKLLAMEGVDGQGRREFAPIAIDIARARISAYLHDERSEPVDANELKAFGDYARTAGDPDQPGLIAWYNYKRRDFTEALEWFKLAIGSGGDTMIAHGLAHTLRELKLHRDTEEVAYAWRQPLVNNAILFIDVLEPELTREIPVYIEPGRLLRYAQVTMDTAAGEGAQALAWYAYNTCQYQTAYEWFRRAVAWHPKEATVYGLALVSRRLKKNGEFWELINRYDGLFPKVLSLIYPGDYLEPPTPCDEFARRGLRREPTPPPALTAAPASPQDALAQARRFGASAGAGRFGIQQSGEAAGLTRDLAPVWAQQQPQGANRRLRENIREPVIDRKLFPVSVDNRNPLRFAPVGRLMGSPAPAAATRAPAGRMAEEPAHAMRELVARRVPGTGPMPYERWGYTLLPGYNGVAAAGAPHTASRAPEGTLWRTLHKEEADAMPGGGTFDATTAQGQRNLELALRTIARAPTVPTPAQASSGPWDGPQPYKTPRQLEAEQDPGERIGREAAAADAPGQPQIGVIQARTTADALSRARTLSREGGGAGSNAGSSASVPPATSDAPLNRIETGASDPLGREATDLYNRGDFAGALAALDRRAAQQRETTGLTMLRAWSLLRLDRVDEARRAFAALGPSGAGGNPDTRGR